MWLESMKQNKCAIVLLAFVGVVFYLMNVYSPLFCDDWHYNFIFKTTTPIQSVGDIFVSQYHHYFGFNGRVVPHLFVQFFDGLAGKGWFNVANTMMFLLFLHMLVTTVSREKARYFQTLSLAVAALVLLLPAFNLTLLWMSGACNYLWTGVFLLIFHRLLQKEWTVRPCVHLLFTLFGLFCGWTHEGFVIGLCASYIVYYAINRKELTPSRITLLIGFFVGTLMMVVSPANFHRAMTGLWGGSENGVLWMYGSTLWNMRKLRITLVLIFALLFVYNRRRAYFKMYVRDNMLWIIAMLVSATFLVVIAKTGLVHAMFGIELFALILLLKLCLCIRIPQLVCLTWNGIMGIFLIFAIFSCRVNYKEYVHQMTQIKDQNNAVIWVNKITISPLFQRFIVPCPAGLWWKGSAEWISERYHTVPFSYYPVTLRDYVMGSVGNKTQFYTNKSLPYYAKRIPKGQKINEVIFVLRKTKAEEIPFYLRPIAHRLARYTVLEIKTTNYKVVDIYDQSYLLVDKNEMVDNRVIDIRYK